ncbi:MAG TPA: hypothetical protein VGK38_11200, partial [Prolixibacteraceae bacterium]
DTPANIKALTTARTQKVLVEFAETIHPDKLREVEGIVEIQHLSEKTWLINGGEADIRPLIFKFAVANGWTILTLNKQESSLENVFLEITR